MSRPSSLIGASPKCIELESIPQRNTGSRIPQTGIVTRNNVNSIKTQPKNVFDQFAEKHHERWRQGWTKQAKLQSRDLSRKKPIKDGTLTDINVPFDHLHPERQDMSREAATVALEALNAYPLTFSWNVDMAAEYIHISWMRRSKIQYDDDRLVVPFIHLPEYVKVSNMESVLLMKFIDSLNKPIVKAVAQQFHEIWREAYQKIKPGQKRIKVNESDGTEVDINVPFDSLHPDWQRENLFAAFAAKEICKLFSVENNDAAAEYLHEQWMLRNPETTENKQWRIDFKDMKEVDKDMYYVQIKTMREQLAFHDPAVVDSASKLHEAWRNTWMKKNPGVPRMKVNMDGSYLDINKPFKELHYDWQRENLVASIAAKEACIFHPRDDDAAADYIHQEWMNRNPKTDTNAHQHVSFAQLPADEQKKDREQVSIMREVMRTKPEAFRDDKPEIGPYAIRDLKLLPIRVLLQSIPDSSTTDESFRKLVQDAGNYIKSPDPFENNRMTPLHYAARAGRASFVSILLENGVDLNLQSSDLFTPLMWASYHERTDVVRLLTVQYSYLLKGNSANGLDMTDKDGWTALMWASCLGYYDIVCLLVEAGADLKLATKDKHGWHAISLASRRNHYKIVKYLTGIDNSIVEVCDERGYNLLHIAVDLNDKTQLATSLASLANSLLSYCEEKKKDFKINFLNAYNKEGMTPLHIAASKGLLNHVKLLVQLGGDIEGRSKSNIYPGEKATPLFFAAIYGHDDVVRYLLSVNEEGARFNETVHIQATGGRRGFKITNPFREAAYRGHRQVLMALLQHPKIFSHDPKKPLLTEKSFHSLQVKNLGDLSIWLKSILVGLTHEGSDVVVEDQFIEMIKSVKASREAQMLYDCFISKYKTNESPYTMISPHSQSPDSQFNQKWNMFKGEYITAGSESIDTDSADSGIQFFWGKRGHERWYKLWNGFFKGAVESHCVSYTIDIPYTSHRAFLALFLLIDRDADTEIPRTRENNKGAYSIFDIDFVEASVLHAWKKYGFWYHIRDLLLFLSYLVLSSYTNYTFNVISSDDHSTYKNAGLILVKVELALTAFFSYRWIFIHLPKITQTLSKHAHLFRYVTNVGIWVEISWLGWYSLTFAGSIIRLRRGVETDLSSYLMAIATMLQYMLVITYFRPFRAFGPLIGMIEAIIWDIRYYIMILGVVLFGFSQALYLTAWEDPGDGSVVLFGTPASALAQSIVYLVGNPQFPPGWTSDSAVSTFLAVMLTVVGSIVMMNLLIAIMNNTYSRIKSHDESEWLKQLCITITEQRFIWPTQPDKFVHYLRRKIDVDREKNIRLVEASNE